MSVIVLVADGARVDAFAGQMEGLPALRRLRDEGGLYEITTVFPSVTGPAYVPFLTGQFPGPAGIPGIRWYDRARTACSWPDYARSYVGYQFTRMDEDLNDASPTIFELVPDSIAALSVITRGLSPSGRLGTLTMRSATRVAFTHFRGRPEHWLDVDREVRDTIPRRVKSERPDYVLAAFTGMDKASHSRGHDSSLAHDALQIVDASVARLRDDAERGGWWQDLHLWVVSDHGHSPVHSHEDLERVIAAAGLRTVAHPFAFGRATQAVVMVSGNAMAHIYLDPARRERAWWPALEARWNGLVDVLLKRDSVDLILLPKSPTECEIRSQHRGTGVVTREKGCYSYARRTGDPLELGADCRGRADEMHDRCSATNYPDGVVQISSLAAAARAGDVILSASPGWDLRARYEPIPHVSSHGSLHRDHMMVPLLMNRPPATRPRRTTDVFASALTALRIAVPPDVHGSSFIL